MGSKSPGPSGCRLTANHFVRSLRPMIEPRPRNLSRGLSRQPGNRTAPILSPETLSSRPRAMKAPKAPGHIPYEPTVQFGRDRIQPICAARPAAYKAEEAHPASRPQAIPGDGFVGIFRAGGNMAAGISNKTGQRQLVEPDQPCSQQASRCLPPGSLPVTRIFAGILRRMIMCRFFTHGY
ncbi:hypothetical protein J2X72_001199 [Phyllobacterium sp. 1468]|nr:hypothetical protein [Phyllobacterium sp. 1468]